MYNTKQEFLRQLEKELTRVGVIDKTEMLADFEEHFTVSAASGMSEGQICEKLGDISEIAKQYAESEKFPVAVADNSDNSNSSDNSGNSDSSDNSANSENVKPDNRTPYEKSCDKYNVFANLSKSTDNNNYSYNYSYNYTTENKEQGPPPPPPQPNNQQPNYSNYENSGIKLNTGISWSGLAVVILLDFFVFIWAIPALFAVTFSLFAVPVALVASGIGVVVGGMFNISGFFTPYTIVPTIFAGVALLALGGLFVLAVIGLCKLCVKATIGVINWHGKMIIGRPFIKNKSKQQPKGETA